MLLLKTTIQMIYLAFRLIYSGRPVRGRWMKLCEYIWDSWQKSFKKTKILFGCIRTCSHSPTVYCHIPALLNIFVGWWILLFYLFHDQLWWCRSWRRNKETIFQCIFPLISFACTLYFKASVKMLAQSLLIYWFVCLLIALDSNIGNKNTVAVKKCLSGPMHSIKEPERGNGLSEEMDVENSTTPRKYAFQFCFLCHILCHLPLSRKLFAKTF